MRFRLRRRSCRSDLPGTASFLRKDTDPGAFLFVLVGVSMSMTNPAPRLAGRSPLSFLPMRLESRQNAAAPAGRGAGGTAACVPGFYPRAVLAYLLAWFFLAAISGCDPGPIDRVRARLELKEGNQSYLRGEYRMAMTHYDRALAHRPALARAHLNRAYSAMALCRSSDDRDVRRALADSAVASLQNYLGFLERSEVETARGPSPDRVEGHIVTLYLDSERPEKAQEFLEARHERDSMDIATIQMLAQLAVDRGDLESALQWNRKRVSLQPDSAMAHYALSVVTWQFSYYDKVLPGRRAALLDEGLAAALRAEELDPKSSEALTYANLLYREKAKHAANETERAASEARYLDYEARARRLRETQNGVLPHLVGSRDTLERAPRTR